jgi:predicted nuclease with TOPRIM domain
MGDLEDLKTEVKDIIKRLQSAETAIQVSEATRTERHSSMLDRFERVESRLTELENRLITDMNKLHTKIDDLQDLAVKGKVSLKTLWVVGAMVAGGLALLSSWLQVFK